MDLGLSSVRVWVKVRVSVRFMVSFCHFKVHKMCRSTRPHTRILPVAPSLQFYLLECPPTVCIRWGSRFPMGRGNFEGGCWRPFIRYRDSVVIREKRMNQSRCRLGC